MGGTNFRHPSEGWRLGMLCDALRYPVKILPALA